MKLELKHLAPYLPYELKYFIDFTDGDTACWVVEGLTVDEIFIDGYDCNYDSENCKPILRPLSDLTKEITIDGETFIPIKKLGTRYSSIKSMLYENTVQLDVYDTSSINLLHYLTTFEKLYEMHFDIHNLIEKGLAIDINTIK